MATEEFDPKELRDWWRDPRGKPYRDALSALFPAAISDMRKAVASELFHRASGHAAEATVVEDAINLVDGLIQDQKREKEEAEEGKGARK